jgi:hypothetical protein
LERPNPPLFILSGIQSYDVSHSTHLDHSCTTTMEPPHIQSSRRLPAATCQREFECVYGTRRSDRLLRPVSLCVSVCGLVVTRGGGLLWELYSRDRHGRVHGMPLLPRTTEQHNLLPNCTAGSSDTWPYQLQLVRLQLRYVRRYETLCRRE